MILVTGGTGFIGSNLVAALSDAGERVSINDTLGSGEKWKNIAHHEIDELVSPERLDDFLTRRGSEIRSVVHLGAISSTMEGNVDLIADSNLRLSQRIWRFCAHQEIPLAYASSAATYGDGSLGFSDTDDRDALARLRPLNPYAWSKHAFDRWARREVDEGRPSPRSWYGLKFFNVYGPNEYHKGEMRSVVAKSYENAADGQPVTLFRSHHPDYRDGGQKRDFVYVDDCVEVIRWLLAKEPESGLYNVGTGAAQSWVELMTALYSAVGKRLSVEWTDVPQKIRGRYQYFTEANIDKLRAAGYDRCFLNVEEGVARYVQDFLSTADRYR
jgi:ADP-L-glycero-D-manno-heptose 6-epimerase